MSLTRRRSLGLLAAAAMLVGACGGSATPSPSAARKRGTSGVDGPGVSRCVAVRGRVAVRGSRARPDDHELQARSRWQDRRQARPRRVAGARHDLVGHLRQLGDGRRGLRHRPCGASGTPPPTTSATASWRPNVPTVANGGVVINGDRHGRHHQSAPGRELVRRPADHLRRPGLRGQVDDGPGQLGNIQGTIGWENISGVDGGTGTNCVAHFTKIPRAGPRPSTKATSASGLRSCPSITSRPCRWPMPRPSSTPRSRRTTGVYSGPYMPTNWAAGAEIDYVPNPQFWTTIKKATAPFDSVVFKYYSDATAEIAGFKNGETDVAMNFNHNDLATLRRGRHPGRRTSMPSTARPTSSTPGTSRT